MLYCYLLYIKKTKISINKYSVICDIILFLIVSLWIFGIFHIHFATIIYIIFSIIISILKKKNKLFGFYRIDNKDKEDGCTKVSPFSYLIGFIINTIIMFIYDTPLYNSGYVVLIVFCNIMCATGILCVLYLVFDFLLSNTSYTSETMRGQVLFILTCIIFYFIAVAIAFI